MAIPKILYTTWVSDKPYPEEYKKYLDGWKVLMPEWEIIVLDFAKVLENNFTNKALAEKKYVLMGHYARCERLFATGGIYLDIDVEAIKSFNPLLSESFIGREDDGMVNNAVMGFEQGHPMMKACMDYMDAIDFETPNIELETGPWMFNKLYKDFDVKVYPPEYFYPYHYTKQFTPECIKENTYAVHHWAHSWGNT